MGESKRKKEERKKKHLREKILWILTAISVAANIVKEIIEIVGILK